MYDIPRSKDEIFIGFLNIQCFSYYLSLMFVYSIFHETIEDVVIIYLRLKIPSALKESGLFVVITFNNGT